ncbi:hypothetical protein [Parendozoicomonas haliclonae]|nr:hypothetical protein [Parendozoicomonas haliclonae]
MASLAQEVLTTHEPFLLAVLPSFINRYIQCGYDERLFHIVMAQSYSNLENSQALVNEQASQRWVSWLAAGIEHALYEQQATLPKFCNALEAKIEPSALVDYAASKQLEDPKTIQLILPQLIGRLRADLEVYKRELPDHTAQPNKQAKEKEEKAQPEAIAIQPLSSSPKRRAN